MSTSTAYKVLTADQWQALQADDFSGAPVDLHDGYIHLSTAAQLTETVDKHFAGQHGLVVAAVDLENVADILRWEPSRHGQLFPHLYGRLPLRAISASAPLTRDARGAVVLPV